MHDRRRVAGSLLDPFKDAVAALLADDAATPATVIREHLLVMPGHLT